MKSKFYLKFVAMAACLLALVFSCKSEKKSGGGGGGTSTSTNPCNTNTYTNTNNIYANNQSTMTNTTVYLTESGSYELTTSSIQQVLQAKCNSCHSSTGSAKTSGDFTTEAGAKAKGMQIAQRVAIAAGGAGIMPPAPQAALPPDEIELFKQWQLANFPTWSFTYTGTSTYTNTLNNATTYPNNTTTNTNCY